MTVDLDVGQIRRWAEQNTETGTEIAGWRQFAGFGVDPDTGDLVDYSAEWKTSDIETMLDTDGRARAAEQALTLPLRGAPLTIKPGDGDTGEADAANAMLAGLGDPVEETLGQAAQSLIYRVTFLEKLWTVVDGEFTYSRLAWRPPDACAVTRDPGSGALTGFKQSMTWWGGRNATGQKPSWVQIPAAKAAVFVHGRARNPIRGVSELQAAYRCYQDKQKIRWLWTVFLKGAAVQRLVAHTQPGSEQKIANALAQLSSGGVAAVAEQDLVGLDILNATDSGAFFKEALAYLDDEMLASILAGFLGLSGAATSGRGSFALSKDQSDFFTQAQDASAREIAATFRTQIVRPFLLVNRGAKASVPRVTLGPIDRATAQEQMDFLKGLVASPSGTILPSEFVDELSLQIAAFLDLDTDKVRAAIKDAEARAQQAPPAGATTPAAAGLHGAVNAGVRIVRAGQSGAAPLPAA